MINIEFLGVAYIVSKSVDWILQWQPHAEAKSKDFNILTLHSVTYSTFTSSFVSLILRLDLMDLLFLLFVLFSTHWIIDTRIPVKYIMHLKGIPYDQMDTKYGWLQVGIDQRLHELVILILALVI